MRAVVIAVSFLVPCIAYAQVIRGVTPTPGWRRILSAPRLGARLTFVAVDPDNADRIYVGTEASTVLWTDDGGNTWVEQALTPTTVERHSLSGPPAPDVRQLRYGGGHFQFELTAPFVDDYDPFFWHESTHSPTLFFSIRTDGLKFKYYTRLRRVYVSETLLANVGQSREDETVPVRAIAVCPGGIFSLLVATTQDLFGSTDRGLTFVRLYGQPAGAPSITRVACSKVAPNDIALATGQGLYRSQDGGVSFEEVAVRPGIRVTAVAYPAFPDEKVPTLLTGIGDRLFDTHVGTGGGWLYPNYDDVTTAPWTNIRSIAVTSSGQFWLGTDDGLRASFDAGKNWKPTGQTLFNRQRIREVVAGLSDGGTEQLVVLTPDRIYSTEDGGETWSPFFEAVSPRTVQHVAALPISRDGKAAWWVLTAGELYATLTNPSFERAPNADPGAIEWAEVQMRRTPPLDLVLNSVLERTRLSNAAVNSAFEKSRSRAWAPEILTRLDYSLEMYAGQIRQQGYNPYGRLERHRADNVFFCIYLSWALGEFEFSNATRDLLMQRDEVHRLRNQVVETVEDAYVERMLHLQRIASGRTDPLQSAMLRERIEGLDAVINIWNELKVGRE